MRLRDNKNTTAKLATCLFGTLLVYGCGGFSEGVRDLRVNAPDQKALDPRPALVLDNPHKNYPFFLKGQTHAHSRGDGDGEVETRHLAIRYKDRGYSFMSITRHNMETPDAAVSGFLHIPGAEDGNWGDHHIVVLGLDKTQSDMTICEDEDYDGLCDLGTGPCENVQPRIDYYSSQGAVSVFAHPNGGQEFHSSDQRDRSGYTGVEIYNKNTEAHSFVGWWDSALGFGHRSWAFAGDDYEKEDQTMNGGWILVNSPTSSADLAAALAYPGTSAYASAKALHESHIISEIQDGNFFAIVRAPFENTTSAEPTDPGPRLHLETAGSRIRLSLLPDRSSESDTWSRASLIAQEWTGEVETLFSNTNSAAVTFDLEPHTPYLYRYVRVEVEQQRHGEKYLAYSQPIMIRYLGIPIPSVFSDYSNREWLVTKTCSSATPCPVRSQDVIGLFNNHKKSWIKYGSREYGVNLVWSSTANRSIRFELPGNSEDALTYGTSFAIKVGAAGYLKYEARDYGINLAWSNTPVYEWRLAGGPAESVLYQNQPFGLVNLTVGSSAVHCPRDYGIDLKWRHDCSR